MVFWDYLYQYEGGTPDVPYIDEERYMSYLRSKSQNSHPTPANRPPADDAARRLYPALFEYLTATEEPGGEARQTATLLLFVSEGSYKLCLNDRHTEAHLWASSATLEDVFLAIEERLVADTPDWRSANRNGTTGKRRG